METKLPQKYTDSFIGKIKNFLKSLFLSQKDNGQIVYDESKYNIEELQKKYESGEILASNMSDEQYEKLVNLYTEQINNLKSRIAEKEMKLYKNIV